MEQTDFGSLRLYGHNGLNMEETIRNIQEEFRLYFKTRIGAGKYKLSLEQRVISVYTPITNKDGNITSTYLWWGIRFASSKHSWRDLNPFLPFPACVFLGVVNEGPMYDMAPLRVRVTEMDHDDWTHDSRKMLCALPMRDFVSTIELSSSERIREYLFYRVQDLLGNIRPFL